jgi:hypothetical protein
MNVLPGPPYHDQRTEDTVRDELLLVDGQPELISPLPVLQKVVGQYSWLGSHVDFAAWLLTSAFECFTYQNVSLIVELILLMEYKYESEITTEQLGIHKHRKDVVTDVLYTLIVMVDKVAAVNGNVDRLATELYQYNESLYSEKLVLMNGVGVLKKKMDNLIETQCEVQSRETVLKKLGFTFVRGSPRSRQTTLQALKSIIYQITDRMIITYNSFRIESLNLETWNQILNYQSAVVLIINPYVINPNEASIDTETLYEITTTDSEDTEPFEIGILPDQVTEKTDDRVTEKDKATTDANTHPSEEQNSPKSGTVVE